MNTLELVDVEVAGLTTPGNPLSAAYSGQRLALVGDWAWLWEHLLGKRELEGGEVRLMGEPGRQAVIAGRIGVALPDSIFSEAGNVTDLLQLNLRLLGVSPKEAKDRARQQLFDLGLQFLEKNKLSTLNLAERFAVQAALAASSNPAAIVLGAPSFKPEARAFELAVLDKLEERCRVLFDSNPVLYAELLHTVDEVAWLASGQARSTSAQELLRQAEVHHAQIEPGK